jgi:hypothetical protein
MENYIFFSIFLNEYKLVTAVFFFGSLICNQAAGIRVKTISIFFKNLRKYSRMNVYQRCQRHF